MSKSSSLYERTTLRFPLGERELVFHTSSLVRDAQHVPYGEELLLAQLRPQLLAPRQVWVFEAGYGFLGVSLAALCPQATVILSDPSGLAIAAARENIQRNGLPSVQTTIAVGDETLSESQYDLIAGQIPAGVNDHAIEEHFLLAPLRRLAPGGHLWLCGELSLNRLIPRLARKRVLRLREIERNRGQIVYRAEVGGDLTPNEPIPQPDAFFRKQISLALHKQRLSFATADRLFSGHDIDAGTRLLLRFVTEEVSPPADILDLGCGYGPLGLSLARLFPQANVLLSDQDALAVRYTRFNADANQISNARVRLALGMEGIDQNFDLIVSNIPGHIGEAAIGGDFILRPLKHLRPGGHLWVVIVAPLADLIESLASEHEIPLHCAARRGTHAVYRLG